LQKLPRNLANKRHETPNDGSGLTAFRVNRRG